MSRVINIELPNCNDDEWQADQLNDLNLRLESLYDHLEMLVSYEDIQNVGACLDIVDALCEYTGA